MHKDNGIQPTDPVNGIFSLIQRPDVQRGMQNQDPRFVGGLTKRINGLLPGQRGRLISGIIDNLSREKPNQETPFVWNANTRLLALNDVLPLAVSVFYEPKPWRQIQSDYTKTVKGLGKDLDPNGVPYMLLEAALTIAPYTGAAAAIPYTSLRPSDIADVWSLVGTNYASNPSWREISPMVDEIRATAAVTFLEVQGCQQLDMTPGALPVVDFYRDHPLPSPDEVRDFIAAQETSTDSLQNRTRMRQLIILELLKNPAASVDELSIAARAITSEVSHDLGYLQSIRLIPTIPQNTGR